MENSQFIQTTPAELVKLITESVSVQFKDLINEVSNQKTSEEKEFLTRKETGDFSKVSLVTIHEWSANGTLKPYKIGNRTYYKNNLVKSTTYNSKSNLKRLDKNKVKRANKNQKSKKRSHLVNSANFNKSSFKVSFISKRIKVKLQFFGKCRLRFLPKLFKKRKKNEKKKRNCLITLITKFILISYIVSGLFNLQKLTKSIHFSCQINDWTL
jgi:hypothetical protein